VKSLLDIFFGMKDKNVTVFLYGEKNGAIYGRLIGATQDGVLIEGKSDGKDFLECLPMTSVQSIICYADQTDSIVAGPIVVDSVESKIRKILKNKIEGETEYEYNEEDNTLTVELDGETILEGDGDEITVHLESALEAAKELAIAMGAKKILRDITLEE